MAYMIDEVVTAYASLEENGGVSLEETKEKNQSTGYCLVID